MTKKKTCTDPDCIVCEPDPPDPGPAPEIERQWIYWGEGATAMWANQVRTVICAERPHGHASTPLISIAEEEVGPCYVNDPNPVVHGRDVIILTVEDTKWIIAKLTEALTFVGATVEATVLPAAPPEGSTPP